jgi:tyrosine-protein kinase Etk/Wzc
MSEDLQGHAALPATVPSVYDAGRVRAFPVSDSSDSPVGGAGPGPPATVASWVAVLRRSAWLIVGCLIVAVGAAVLVTRRLTPVYEASTALRVELQKGSGPTFEPVLAANNDISTEIEVLRSETLAEEVVDSLRLQLSLDAPRQESRARLFEAIRATPFVQGGSYRLTRDSVGRFRVLERHDGRVLAVVSPTERVDVGGVSFALTPRARELPVIDFNLRSREDAASDLRGVLSVERVVREANIVTIRFRDSDPAIARDVPNALAAGLLAQRRWVRHSEGRGTEQFLRDQLERVAAQLRASEETLRSFREREHVVDLQEEGRNEANQLLKVQADRNALETERASLAHLLASIDGGERSQDSTASPYRNLVAFPSLVRNQAAWQLLASLAAVEDRRTELLARRSAQDPDVRLLTDRIHAIEDQLRSFGTTYLRALTDQAATLDSTLVHSATSLALFPARELALTRLQRQRKLLEDLYTLLQTRLKETEISNASEDSSIRPIDVARLPRTPIAPNPWLNAALAGVGGLLIGLAVAFWRAHADRAVHSRRELSAATGVAVLGLIPRAASPKPWVMSVRSALGIGARPWPAGRRDRDESVGVLGAARGPGAATVRSPRIESVLPTVVDEAFNRLEANLMFGAPRGTTTILVTSPMPSEGKTTVAANLALVASRNGRRVLLIDADLRRGNVNSVFGVLRTPGLSEVLDGTVSFGEAVQSVDVPGPGELHCLATGTLPPGALGVLGGQRLRAWLDVWATRYDLALIDTPPLNAVADAGVLAALSDGVVVVTRAGHTTIDALATAMEHLYRARARVIGVVLNDVDLDRDAVYDDEYRHFRSYAAYYADVGDSASPSSGRSVREQWTP